MNLLHMKYAIAVAEAGSINKASARLLIAQPNLSRAIKELEAGLGAALFERSSHGMQLTPEGEAYIRCARKILAEVEELENHFREGLSKKQRFSVSAPRAEYIAEAFAGFSLLLGGEPAELRYQETDSLTTVNSLLRAGCQLGIIRYEERLEDYFKQLISRHGLSGKPVAAFCQTLLFSKDSPLSALPEISPEALSPLVEVAQTDSPLPFIEAGTEETAGVRRQIHLLGRADPLRLLCKNPEAFMWEAPFPEDLLVRYGLMQRPCAGIRRGYRDLLVYPKGYKLSPLDKAFLGCLDKAKRRFFPAGGHGSE